MTAQLETQIKVLTSKALISRKKQHRLPASLKAGAPPLQSTHGAIAYLRYISNKSKRGGAARMKTYSGSRTMDGIQVLVDGAPLDERTDIKEFTDLGFEWTYEGASPAQLALAMLADHLGDDEKALAHYEPFMREIVANFDNDWEMTSEDIEAALTQIAKHPA
jgi:hypothetical protein